MTEFIFDKLGRIRVVDDTLATIFSDNYPTTWHFLLINSMKCRALNATSLAATRNRNEITHSSTLVKFMAECQLWAPEVQIIAMTHRKRNTAPSKPQWCVCPLIRVINVRARIRFGIIEPHRHGRGWTRLVYDEAGILSCIKTGRVSRKRRECCVIGHN